jgi:RNA polymerase sigma factor (sigma-70 family)
VSGAPALGRRAHQLLRDLAPQVLGAVTRRYRDFTACEDAVQEALLAASVQWPTEGMPDNPRGWLIQVAARRLADHVRADAARRHREELVVSLVPVDEQIALAADEAGPGERDDTLELVFMCCHPTLSSASAIALTLRAVGGLTTFEIAKAFLVPEATMAQRISRAKQTIKSSGVPFAMPDATEIASRLETVTHTLYLVFNEGYTATTGSELARVELSDEAIRLVRMLHRLLPEDCEVAGLLALMVLTDARRRARTGPEGQLVPLDEQDRALWDRAAIDEGVAILGDVLPRGRVGPYQLQAAIAAVHDEAPSTAETDWAEIRGLYEALLELFDNPMIALNHAIAVAMVEGPEAGLARVDALAGRLAESHRVDAVRGHLLERMGDRSGAVASYRRAASRTTSVAEQHYLMMRAARLAAETDGPAAKVET